MTIRWGECPDHCFLFLTFKGRKKKKSIWTLTDFVIALVHFSCLTRLRRGLTHHFYPLNIDSPLAPSMKLLINI